MIKGNIPFIIFFLILLQTYHGNNQIKWVCIIYHKDCKGVSYYDA